MSPSPWGAQLSPVLAAAASERAWRRIKEGVVRTPLLRAPALSRRSKSQIWLKAEHLQHTGSFKFRGALSALTALPEQTREKGVIAASTGNHGMAVALAAQRMGCEAIIYVPEGASSSKVAKIGALGATAVTVRGGCLEAEQAARAHAQAEGKAFISPYNDLEVVAGQGTIAFELLEQAPDLDAVYVAVGGGGLISGIGSVLAARAPRIEVVACQPMASRVMAESVLRGHIVQMDEDPTLSDATAGGLEADTLTLGLVQQCVERFMLVDEASIAAAVRDLYNRERFEGHTPERWLVEGAAGVALAAALDARERPGRKVAVVLCGRNVAPETARAMLDG